VLMAAPVVAAVVGCASAVAAPATSSSALERYQSERAACLNGQSQQARGTCLTEANAAYALARQGALENPSTHFDRNARARCDALNGDEHTDCLARMSGEGTVEGSVKAGGILRELQTEEVIPSPAAGTAPVPAQ
jgi:hypothetical protein